MGLYSSKNAIYGGYFEAAIDLDNVEESYVDSFDEAAIMAVVESEQNYNSLMKAVGIAELNFLEENGQEMVYTEANVSGFFAKIKEFFKKIIAKIASILKAFFAKIDSFTKTDKEFLNKYRKDLLKLNLKDMKVNGYKFTHIDDKNFVQNLTELKSVGNCDPDNLATADAAKCDAVIEADEKDNISPLVEAIRGASVGEGKLEAGEYNKSLFEYFRDGNSSKDEIDVDIVAELGVLAAYAETKKTAEKAFRENEKEINDFIKTLDKAEKNLLNEKKTGTEATLQGKRVRAINIASRTAKEIAAVNTTYFGAKLQALKDQSRQAKAICVKALTYKNRNEAAGVDYGTTGSFLSDVEFN